MSLIASLLSTDYVLLDLPARDRQSLFEEAATRIAPRLGVAPKVITASLAHREKLGSTALGQGVAIPHGRIKHLREARGVFVRTREGVAFDAPDQEPVRLLFILLVPEHATDLHLQILSELAQTFGNRALREQLLHSQDPAEIVQLMTTLDAPNYR